MSWLPIIILIAVPLIVLMYSAGIYNRLVTLKNRFANSFSQIEVQLKRRYDLIPNLVETAKAYMSHERETLEAVVAARTRAVSGLQQAAANPGNASAMQALSGAEQVYPSCGSRYSLTKCQDSASCNRRWRTCSLSRRMLVAA